MTFFKIASFLAMTVERIMIVGRKMTVETAMKWKYQNTPTHTNLYKFIPKEKGFQTGRMKTFNNQL